MAEKKEHTHNNGSLSDIVHDALGSTQLVLSDAHVLDDDALLAKYGFGDIERTFSMRDPETNDLLQEREPCFLLLADGFYGKGMHGTWFQEGATIVFADPPNQHMRPLNRAGALNYCKWQESLPQNKVMLDIGDMSEAAVILSKDPRMQQMTPQQAQIATIKVAEGLKLKREGKNAMDLRADQLNANFQPQSGGKAAPILGAKMSDLSQIGPGMTRNVASITGPGAGVRRAAPLGGPPPGR